MSLTYGFFNSVNHDRLYDATQVSSLFDGLICDGVYETYKHGMIVKATSGMNVAVDTGRAWFNHTWTYIDAPYAVHIAEAYPVLKRIDAVVLKIDTRYDFRENSIIVIEGEPAEEPVKPEVVQDDGEGVYQYPLAYITVNENATEITRADIENAVGTSACPFVTGIISVMDIDDLIGQWGDQFELYLYKEAEKFLDWRSVNEQQFIEWFRSLQYDLDGDVAGHLENKIESISQRLFIDENDYIGIDYDKVPRRWMGT